MASTGDNLFRLIGENDVDGVRELLDEQPWLAAERDAEGVSPLLRARYQMHRALVAVVRPHVDELDVFEAAAFGELDRLSELLAEDRDLVDARSGDGFTPLHLAAFFGQTDGVRLLLAPGAACDPPGLGWMTGSPLHAAAAGSHASIVEMLLGPEPIRTRGNGAAPHRFMRPRPMATSQASRRCSRRAPTRAPRTMTARRRSRWRKPRAIWWWATRYALWSAARASAKRYSCTVESQGCPARSGSRRR